MSEKKYTAMKKLDGTYIICKSRAMLMADEVIDLLDDLHGEVDRLRGIITLLEYQLKVQDRIIDEYEQY